MVEGVWYIAITRKNKNIKIWGGGGVYGYTKRVNRVERGCTALYTRKVNGGA